MTVERKRRVYRTVVTEAPDGPVPRLQWEPDFSGHRMTLAEELSRSLSGDYMTSIVIDPFDYDKQRLPELLITFRVGQSRSSCYRGIAEKRADWYRAHGCKARVDESEPIVWTEGKAS